MNTLGDILLKYGFAKKPGNYSTEFKDVEALAKFPLPEDYKYYLSNFHSFEGSISPEYLCLWSKNKLTELNNEYDIVSMPKTLGIGSNGAGEFIAIIALESNKYKMVLSPFIDLDSHQHIGIGNSFTDFIARLDRGQEWFDDTE